MLRVWIIGLAGLFSLTAVIWGLPAQSSWAGSNDCPDGTTWEDTMQRCIEVEVTDQGDEDLEDGDEPNTIPVGDVTCMTKEFGGREPFEVPCYNEFRGYWSNVDSCYWQRADPAPAPTDPVWEGRYPEGAVYEPYCLPRINVGQNNCGEVGGPNNACREWRATPPWEVPDPAELARQALQRMRLTGPDIGMAPPEGTQGVVGLPVWLWNNISNRTWTSTSDPACDAGLCVTVTATAESITWDMGNGDTIDCDQGTPYHENSNQEPTCSYTYQRASTDQPDRKYEIIATTHWNVTWQANNGLTGQLDPFDLSTRAELGITSLAPVLVE